MITIQEFKKEIRSDIGVKDFQIVLMICQRENIKTMEQLHAFIKDNALMGVELYTGGAR